MCQYGWHILSFFSFFIRKKINFLSLYLKKGELLNVYLWKTKANLKN